MCGRVGVCSERLFDGEPGRQTSGRGGCAAGIDRRASGVAGARRERDINSRGGFVTGAGSRTVGVGLT